jgi:dihydroxyacetone kinase DhaKLM complex PTS-EIIA-like component DhaM
MSDDGVAVLFDLGSALMTAEMVMEQFEEGKVMLADAPIVEGAVVAAVSASMGLSLSQVVEEAHTAAETPKLQ